METSKLKWLSENQRDCFLFALINPPRMQRWVQGQNWVKSVPDSNFQSQSWDGSSPRQQTPSSIRCWRGSLVWIKYSEPDSQKAWILRPRDLRDRYTAKCVAPGPVGKFLLGSNPSFCFSPLVIMFLASVLCFLVCKVLSHVLCFLSLRRILWVRCFVIPIPSEAQSSCVMCSVSNSQWLMGLGLEYGFLKLYLLPCWPHHTTYYLHWWRHK